MIQRRRIIRAANTWFSSSQGLGADLECALLLQ